MERAATLDAPLGTEGLKRLRSAEHGAEEGAGNQDSLAIEVPGWVEGSLPLI